MMSGTRYVPRSFISRTPSSSTSPPCSTDATPARAARLIASAPCACAATRRPHIAASVTTAFNSSCEYCGAPADSSSDSTPAPASTLIQSAPRLTFSLILFRSSSTPSAIPENPSTRRYGENPFRSPCPPVALSASVATAMRGPSDGALVDRVAEGNVDEFHRTDVAHSRESGLERASRVERRAHGGIDRAAPERVGVILFALHRQVCVYVEETGQNRAAAEIDRLCAGRNPQP